MKETIEKDLEEIDEDDITKMFEKVSSSNEFIVAEKTIRIIKKVRQKLVDIDFTEDDINNILEKYQMSIDIHALMEDISKIDEGKG